MTTENRQYHQYVTTVTRKALEDTDRDSQELINSYMTGLDLAWGSDQATREAFIALHASVTTIADHYDLLKEDQ